MSTPITVAPVDEMFPVSRLVPLGLQHVLVMYAGAVAVPLIVGRALKLAPEQVALLISADLFCCGLVTLIQSLGATRWFGIRMPVMMGVTFAAVGPMLAMAADPTLGITGIFGAVIGAGVIAILIAPFIGRLLPLFPPVVTGTIIAVIGVSLMRVAIQWAVGGPALQPLIPDPAVPAKMIANPAYAALDNLGIGLMVLVAILLIAKFGRGFLANIAVLLGIVLGCVVAALLGKMSFAKVAQAKLFSVVLPLQFGVPTFDLFAILTMTLVMIVVMIESLGMFLALSEITGKRLTQADLSAGLRTDGIGTVIGGLFNTFPYTSFSQNVGLVGVTGVRSRWVCVAGGVILMIMGLIPALGALVEAVPQFVLGGAGIVMFGMVAATGVRILADVDYKSSRHNLFIVAISLGFGMIPLVAPDFFEHLPKALAPLLHSGILLAAIAAVALNVYFNGLQSATEARRVAAAGASHSEAG
ncbi:MAG TPA: nucleobase:cation symporter-2 family protein [Burkholderiaceae bacterium]|nr:nucleobase:cation symporter-2 family protein [Burkholderiaceae bacterium]